VVGWSVDVVLFAAGSVTAVLPRGKGKNKKKTVTVIVALSALYTTPHSCITQGIFICPQGAMFCRVQISFYTMNGWATRTGLNFMNSVFFSLFS
jgi:hypothetical protein